MTIIKICALKYFENTKTLFTAETNFFLIVQNKFSTGLCRNKKFYYLEHVLFIVDYNTFTK